MVVVFLSGLCVATAVGGCQDLCCTVDSECADSARCFEGLCARRCDHASQCLQGEVCLPAGVCVRPERPDSFCSFDWDDTPNYEPDPGPGPDPDVPVDGGPTGCDADPEEPNDSAASASTLGSGRYRICVAGDEDFFRIPARAGATVIATISFDDNTGDLDLQLLGPAGNVLDSSQGVDNEEQVSALAQVSGDHTVRIYGFGGATGPYNLEIVVEDGPSDCVDDAWEPNDDALNPAPLFDIENAQACPGDQDYYERFLGGPGIVEVIVDLEGPGRIEYEISHPASGFFITLDTDETNAFDFFVGAGGPLTVRLLQVEGPAEGTPYDLVLFYEPDEGECFFDEWEPNDDPGDAASLPIDATGQAFVEGFLCVGDADYFQVALNQGLSTIILETFDDVAVELTARHPLGGIEVSQTIFGFGELELDLPFPGLTEVSLLPLEDAPSGYFLQVFTPPGGGGCEPDEYEPNNGPDFIDPNVLNAPLVIDANFCPAGDFDGYLLLFEPDTVQLLINVDGPPPQDLFVGVIDVTTQEIVAQWAGGTLSLGVSGMQSGQFVVVAAPQSAQAATAAYQLDINVVGGE